ncbi:MAG: T9SS type A sorting domain-containing protein [Bacteroidia bacterium]|nr:T9SS type A sorting domain-containing protein [Bacteroidia bacterium]
MTRISKTILVLFISCFYITIVQGQTTILSSGSNASGGNGTVSCSIGQVVYTTNIGASGRVTQGVQQPFEISIEVGVEQANDINLVCSAYPNPADDYLTLEVKNSDNKNLSYQLFDVKGKLLKEKKVTGNVTRISMVNLLPSVYLLKVIDNQKEIKIFKIIKK